MQIAITDKGDLKAFAAAIRREANGKALLKEMRTAFRAEIKPAVQAVKANYAGGGRVRPALRRATRGEVRTSGKQAGIRVRVDGRKVSLGGHSGSIPALWEGYKRPWRHPVYGDRDTWVTQQPPNPGGFDRATKPFEQKIHDRIDQIATNLVRRLGA